MKDFGAIDSWPSKGKVDRKDALDRLAGTFSTDAKTFLQFFRLMH
jgi:hypothetical protein